jgi:hypothetical protein
MPTLDIFSGSAFSMVALTDAINKMPYVPGRIGQLGLFREQGVSTTSVMIEEREGKQAVDQQFARWVLLHVQSNPLPICTGRGC